MTLIFGTIIGSQNTGVPNGSGAGSRSPGGSNMMMDDASGYVITAGERRCSSESQTNLGLRRSVLDFMVKFRFLF